MPVSNSVYQSSVIAIHGEFRVVFNGVESDNLPEVLNSLVLAELFDVALDLWLPEVKVDCHGELLGSGQILLVDSCNSSTPVITVSDLNDLVESALELSSDVM